MPNPDLFVFTGTSGSGRKTIAHRVCRELELLHVVSCTTRPPRNTERPDQDYHYLSEAEFAESERNGEFVQTARIDRHRYGIRKRDLDACLAEGSGVYLILNREGAEAIKRLYGDRVVRLFLYVDKTTVRERLEAKGAPFDQVESYLEHYQEEVGYRKACEHVLENRDLSATVAELKRIIQSYLAL